MVLLFLLIQELYLLTWIEDVSIYPYLYFIILLIWLSAIVATVIKITGFTQKRTGNIAD